MTFGALCLNRSGSHDRGERHVSSLGDTGSSRASSISRRAEARRGCRFPLAAGALARPGFEQVASCYFSASSVGNPSGMANTVGE